MHKVSFSKFEFVPDEVKNEWKEAAYSVIESAQFIGGDWLHEFENAWANKIGVDHAIGVGNGYDGLQITLRSLGIGKGCNVAVPSHTFIATWLAVHATGANPVGIDVNSLGLMDLDQLMSHEVKIDAVIPVHMHGAMVPMEELTEWAVARDVVVVEDAAQSHMSKSGSIVAGAHSTAGVFSLYPTKNLGALGDAGIVTTKSEELATAIRQYRNYGAAVGNKYKHEILGVNSRLDAIQAAFLLVSLKHLDAWNARRQAIAQLYISNLNENCYLEPMNNNQSFSVWHHFPVVTSIRHSLRSRLSDVGIETDIHYPYLAAHEYHDALGRPREKFPVGERLANSILSLPISPWHTDDEIIYVCDKINEFCKS